MFVWLAQRPKCYNVFEEYIAENPNFPYNPELFENTSDLAEDWYWFSYFSGLHNGQNTSIFPTNTMLLKIPNNGAHLVSFGTKGQQWWDLDPWIEGLWTLRILLMIYIYIYIYIYIFCHFSLYDLKLNYFHKRTLFSHYFSIFPAYYIILLLKEKPNSNNQQVVHWHELQSSG